MPASLNDAKRLYLCYLRSLVAFVRIGRPLAAPGELVGGTPPLRLRLGSAVVQVEPESDDLGLILLAHEPLVFRWFRPRRGEFVVDIGSNIGGYAVRACLAGCDVMAIEPNPEAAAKLRRTIAENHWKTVELIEAAASSVDGEAVLFINKSKPGLSSLASSSGGTPVRVRTVRIDSLLGEHDSRTINWLKMDVEGSEVEVLKGAMRTLSHTRHVIVEVSTSSVKECERVLVHELGFRVKNQLKLDSAEYWLLESPSNG